MRLAPLLLLAALTACGDAPAERVPNIVLLSVDTLRADHLSCYGYGRPTSPTIDALAARGTLFEDVSATSPWTTPSHATMLTGLYPAHHGVIQWGTRLADDTRTLAAALSERGYQTMAVVNSINVAMPELELDRGFDTFVWIEETDRAEDGTIRIPNRGPEVFAAATAALDACDPDAPFFLFLHAYDVHADLTPDARFQDEFVTALPGRLDGTAVQLARIRDTRQRVTENEIRWLVQMYDAELRQFDELLGTFLAELDERSPLAETLLMLTSDHGEEFFEHGAPLHGRTQYQEMLAVPLILAGPRVPGGLRIAQPVGLVDIVPTLLGVAGIEPWEGLDGIDLARAFTESKSLPASRVFFAGAEVGNFVGDKEVYNTRYMVRFGDDKLHVDRLTMQRRLFDLSADPGERIDLAPTRRKRARGLLKRLERHLAEEVESSLVETPVEDFSDALEALGYG